MFGGFPLYIVGKDCSMVGKYPKSARRARRCPLYRVLNIRYTNVRVELQNAYHRIGIDEEIKDQSTELHNLDSILMI